MPEEDSPIPRLLELLVTKSYAVLASFAVTLGGAMVLLLGERLDRSTILASAGSLAGILLATVWTAVTITTRLRSKISMLGQDILSLQSRPSPALAEVTHRDQVLVAVYEAGDDDSKLSEVTQLSQARVDDWLHELVKAGSPSVFDALTLFQH
jgi:hypothetical protein